MISQENKNIIDNIILPVITSGKNLNLNDERKNKEFYTNFNNIITNDSKELEYLCSKILPTHIPEFKKSHYPLVKNQNIIEYVFKRLERYKDVKNIAKRIERLNTNNDLNDSQTPTSLKFLKHKLNFLISSFYFANNETKSIDKTTNDGQLFGINLLDSMIKNLENKLNSESVDFFEKNEEIFFKESIIELSKIVFEEDSSFEKHFGKEFYFNLVMEEFLSLAIITNPIIFDDIKNQNLIINNKYIKDSVKQIIKDVSIYKKDPELREIIGFSKMNFGLIKSKSDILKCRENQINDLISNTKNENINEQLLELKGTNKKILFSNKLICNYLNNNSNKIIDLIQNVKNSDEKEQLENIIKINGFANLLSEMTNEFNNENILMEVLKKFKFPENEIEQLKNLSLKISDTSLVEKIFLSNVIRDYKFIKTEQKDIIINYSICKYPEIVNDNIDFQSVYNLFSIKSETLRNLKTAISELPGINNLKQIINETEINNIVKNRTNSNLLIE